MLFRAQAMRGFGILEMLITVAILLILVSTYSHFHGFGEGTGESTRTTLDSTSETACSVSRQNVASNIEMWQFSHPGLDPTPDALREAQINMRCPHSRIGGTYVIVDGEIYCTDHDPPPARRPAVAGTGGYTVDPVPGRNDPPPAPINLHPSPSGGGQSSPQGRPNPLQDIIPQLPAMP